MANGEEHGSRCTCSICCRACNQNIYEIYTKDPDTGIGGWEIKWVRSTPQLIKTFPDFDVVITVNDFPATGDTSRIIDWT